MILVFQIFLMFIKYLKNKINKFVLIDFKLIIVVICLKKIDSLDYNF